MGAAPHPRFARLPGIGGVVLFAAERAPRDAQVRPLAGRPDDRVAVARKPCRDWKKLFSELGLTRFKNRDVREFDKVVVVAVHDQTGLHEVLTAALERQVQLDAGRKRQISGG